MAGFLMNCFLNAGQNISYPEDCFYKVVPSAKLIHCLVLKEQLSSLLLLPYFISDMPYQGEQSTRHVI